MGYLGTPIDTNNTFQSLVGKRFNGDGSETEFTLDIAPTSVLDIEVFVENVRQDPNSAYSLSGTTLTFSAAPDAGTNNIYVVHQAKAVATISAGAGTVNAASMDNTVISGQTALAAEPADTDEFLVSDAGTIKRIDYSLIKATNTPAFFANKSATQNISNNAYTKVAIDTEVFDTDSAYDNSSNYRFTVPSGKAGKYFLFAQVTLSHTNKWREGLVAFYKNGNQDNTTRSYKYFGSGNNQAEDFTVNISGAYDLSVGDYIEVYGYINGGASTQARFISNGTNFGGYKIIGA